MSGPRQPVPVTILAGFLGAGKTTLLRHVLDDPQGVRYGVLVNDFGAVNIDAALIAGSAADQMSLENGCVCCTIRSGLVEALAALVARDPAPDRVIIEASGVSRPQPIGDALEADDLRGRVVLDGIFCVIDAAGFGDLDDAAMDLALDQAAGADIVILNKIDLAAPDQPAAIEATLGGALPRLRLVRTVQASVPRDLLFGARAAAAAPHHHAPAHVHHHHGDGHAHDHHGHADAFEAWSWSSDRPVDPARLRVALGMLPQSLMRVKGVLRAAGVQERLVYHLVGKRSKLTRESGEPPLTSTLVAIARRGSFDPAALTRLFDDCLAEI